MGGSHLTVRRLRAYDVHCLRVETPDRPAHLGVLAILDGTSLLDGDGSLRRAELLEALDARSREVPTLRRRLHWPGFLQGGPIWVDDGAFRIERHVDLVDLPPPAPASDRDIDEERLWAEVERLVKPPLDRTRPLWRLWVLSGLPDRRIALLIVLHHALADGLAAMAMARSLLEGSPSPLGPRPAHPDQPVAEPVPPGTGLLVDHLRGIGRTIAAVARPKTWRLVGEVFRMAAHAAAIERTEQATPLNGPVGPRRRLSTLHVARADLQRACRLHDCGSTDLLLGLIAAGVRELLTSRGLDVTGLRPRVGLAVALRRGATGTVGNDIGSVLVPLPLDAGDPLRRLSAIRAERERANSSPTVAAEPQVRAVMGRLPGFRRRMERQRLVNIATTWLPGPPGRIEILGAPVVALVPVAPLAANLGLSFVALSYAGDVTIAVRADADRFPDLPVLTDAMAREWAALKDRPVEQARRRRPAVTVATGRPPACVRG